VVTGLSRSGRLLLSVARVMATDPKTLAGLSPEASSNCG
jgi:hypothetical protein